MKRAEDYLEESQGSKEAGGLMISSQKPQRLFENLVRERLGRFSFGESYDVVESWYKDAWHQEEQRPSRIPLLIFGSSHVGKSSMLTYALAHTQMLQQQWDNIKKLSSEKIQILSNKLRSIEEQKRMDIAYALASAATRNVLTLLSNKVTLSIDEVKRHISEDAVIGVIVDLCKSRLANYKSNKLIITSLGLKVAKKISSPNE